MYKLAIIALVVILFIPLVSNSFAASNIEIDIHTGSANPNQHLTFYPPASSAYVGDTIMIGNGDTVPHEVVSGTPSTGPDGKFDSGTLNPGQYYSYILQNSDLGTINFYDKNNQWMVGSITVSQAPTGYKVVPNVGKNVGDGKTSFDLQYQSIKNIVETSIGQKDHSLNLVLVGRTNQSTNLVLRLPTGLINGPFLGVQLDGQFINNFTTSQEAGINVLTIPITPLTEQVSIIGSSVVPEFGPVAVLVLAISIVSIVLFTRFRPIHRLE
ncbi:MAG TPA: PEFG-CTERM sorting domain-containing protein [Candidatus Bathyarchaeia archaeon]|nr:PEFG-CTERM sorting domain-containing protein [Candidatus Bathyarchaeia archaeon]